MEEFITLADYEIEFLKQKFKTYNSDEAIEKTIELMVFSGLNPMNLKSYVESMIKRYQC